MSTLTIRLRQLAKDRSISVNKLMEELAASIAATQPDHEFHEFHE